MLAVVAQSVTQQESKTQHFVMPRRWTNFFRQFHKPITSPQQLTCVSGLTSVCAVPWLLTAASKQVAW